MTENVQIQICYKLGTLGIQVVSRMTGKREVLNGDFLLEILSSRWGLCTKHILQECTTVATLIRNNM